MRFSNLRLIAGSRAHGLQIEDVFSQVRMEANCVYSHVSCSKYEHARLIVPDTIHLHQEFGLNSSTRLAFSFSSRAT
jgi:hypothetical protein